MTHRTATILRATAGLAVWLLIVLITAAIGGAGSAGAGEIYQELNRPEWAPPGYLFGPVWTVLYLTMALSAWLVWRSGDWRKTRLPLTLFLIQLVPNALWSWLFFAWQLGLLAFLNILLLATLIVATIISFWRVRPTAAALLLPYLLWVAFAAALNFSIWQLNS